jgi:PAS domain S-box-containing protein
VIFANTDTTHRHPADQRVATGSTGARTPLLGRLSVGAKLMLLALLPVGVLLVFTISASVDDRRKESSLRDFRRATEQSFAENRLATALADERTAAVLARLRPPAASAGQLRSVRADADAALRQAVERAAAWRGSLDLRGRLDAVGRQLNAVRVQVASGSLTVQQSTDAYSSIVRDVRATVRQLDTAGPTLASERPATAYVALGEAIDAAARERVDVARLITRRPSAAVATVRGRMLETAGLDTFRENAPGSLAAELDAVLFSPAGVTVTGVREALDTHPLGTLRTLSLDKWLGVSGRRIASLRRLQTSAGANLATVVSNDLGTARAHGFRDAGILIGVVLLVAALTLALRRSITQPLSEVSEGARHLSSGELAFDIGYSGRDEIGQVASAFRGLRETVERLAGEIHEMSAAVKDNRLEHRADVAAFEGTWSQLLTGLNGTMAAFAELEGRRERAERELGDFFELSLDLLCIANFDGYFTHVNPAAERTLGFSSAELVSRPFVELVHPDDRARSAEVFDTLRLGRDVVQFENRCVRSDGSVCWIQWSTRALLDEQLVYAVGRDVTDRRRNQEEQAALHRVATLVAEGGSPAETFSGVAAEVGQLVDADVAVVLRYEPEHTATIVGGWSVPGIEIPIGSRLQVVDEGVAVRVLDTQHPARVDRFDGPPGSIPAFFRSLGGRCGIGAPITVEARLWGVLVVVSTEPDRFPAGSEQAVAEFTELLATAIANAETREELRQVADEQAALRRVATLVARGTPPSDVFAAVAGEVGRLVKSDRAFVTRYEDDDSVTILAGWNASGEALPIDVRFPINEYSISAFVRKTGQVVRIDEYPDRGASPVGNRAAVGAPITVGGRLWGVMTVGSSSGEPCAPGTEDRLMKFTELVATAIANAQTQAELTASRARLIATADDTRRRIERDLHDGAQQRLVSLALQLRAAQSTVPPELEELGTQLDQIVDGLTNALDELREYARGIHPATLTEGGLGQALRAVARRSEVPVELDVQTRGRLPAPVEVAAYYVVSEALTNTAKHAEASVVVVDVESLESGLRISVRDDGVGGADGSRGSGLVGLKDRVEALGGRISVLSPRGAGTLIEVELPLVAEEPIGAVDLVSRL